MRLRKLKSMSSGRERLVMVGEIILFCSCGGVSSLFMETKSVYRSEKKRTNPTRLWVVRSFDSCAA